MNMKFSDIREDMKDALIQFCYIQDDNSPGYTDDEEILRIIDAAVSVFNKYSGAPINVMPVYRYSLDVDYRLGDEIYPEGVRNSSVLYDSCVYLGTIIVGAYSSDDDGKNGVARGYDVVYDTVKKEIHILYRIMTTDDNIMSVYRVETDSYEGFDVHEFMIEISAQFISRLKKNIAAGIIIGGAK